MANQNLSQFTEKTLVADADWVFVWDTADAISKKVSRNSLLNSGTLATSAPVTISQTWNDAAVAFTAFKVNATSTNSASGSLLLDLQVGGVSQVSVRKDGTLVIPNGGFIRTNGAQPYNGIRIGGGNFNEAALAVEWVNTASISFSVGRAGSGSSWLAVNSTASIGWGSGQDITTGVPLLDTILVRDGAANTLALRNSTAAQTFNVYGTYTSGTVYERLTLSAPSAANAIIGTNKGSGGGTARGLEFQTDGVSRWSISTAGHLLGAADSQFDIGASSANRPRNVYVSQSIRANAFQLNGLSHVYSTVNGNIGLYDNNLTSFNLLQFGGTTNLFPALKRSTTTLQARLADDLAFAPIQGKLTTDTAYTGTVVAATGYITIYDSTGTAYRVPCAV
jgi:hypothetical protein